MLIRIISSHTCVQLEVSSLFVKKESEKYDRAIDKAIYKK